MLAKALSICYTYSALDNSTRKRQSLASRDAKERKATGQKGSRVTERAKARGNPAFLVKGAHMRRQTATNRKIANRDFGYALSNQDCGFLFSGLVTNFKNNLETYGGGGNKMRWLRGKRGQSTLEYTIVLTAIIAGVILAVPTIRQKVQNAFEHASTQMENEVQKIEY